MSLTVLVGLGGAEAAETHREATVRFLARLPLTPADRVYLSPSSPRRRRHRSRERDRGPGHPPPSRPWRAALATATAARVGEYRIERFAFLA